MAIKCPYYFFMFVSKMHSNSPTCIYQFKKFSGVIPPDLRFKGRGEEGRGGEGRGGKAKGRVGLEGTEAREWEGKMKRKGRREREGKEDSS
jgi:hypothetical protein